MNKTSANKPDVKGEASPKGISRVELARHNRSFVYNLFDGTRNLSVTEAHQKAIDRARAMGMTPLNERTVRRAVESLAKLGFLKPVGRSGSNAVVYTRVDVNFGSPEEEKVINVGGNLVSVEDFLKLFADPESEPFMIKGNVLSESTMQALRQRMLYVVMSSGQTGQTENLDKVSKQLLQFLSEVTHVQNVLQSFIESPVWYSHFRDQMALGVRNAQKNDPKLFQLAIDAVRGG